MTENIQNNQLVSYFKEIYNYEKGARDMYNDILLELKDPEDMRQVELIRDDEEKHMSVVEKIIKIIEVD